MGTPDHLLGRVQDSVTLTGWFAGCYSGNSAELR